MYTKTDNRKPAVIPKQLQKQILEENHNGIMHVVIYQYKKFHIIININNYIVIYSQYDSNVAHH